jgi:hypothetical protein
VHRGARHGNESMKSSKVKNTRRGGGLVPQAHLHELPDDDFAAADGARYGPVLRFAELDVLDNASAAVYVHAHRHGGPLRLAAVIVTGHGQPPACYNQTHIFVLLEGRGGEDSCRNPPPRKVDGGDTG